MMFSNSLTALLCIVPLAWAYSSTGDHPFKAPSPGARTSPCPMMNSLANHGFIPRTNISIDVLIAGLEESVGLDATATRIVGGKALLSSSTGDPNTFNLDDIRQHGLIEHDASLSRADTFWGDSFSFNSSIWASTLAHFTTEIITLAQAGAARRDCIAAANASNPEFSFSSDDALASGFETALYMRVFGDPAGNNVRRDWIKILFEEERLPYAEGFPTVPTSVITLEELIAISGQI